MPADLSAFWVDGRAPLFRDFAARYRYRDRRKARWKPSSLKTYDSYMRGRIMPQDAAPSHARDGVRRCTQFSSLRDH